MYNPKGSYGTHLHPLIVAVLATEGDVIEFGMGDFSTSTLHEIIKYQNISIERDLWSFEFDKLWFLKFKQFDDYFHHTILVSDWDDVVLKDDCGVIFIDHAPAQQRQKDIVKYQDSCEIMVVHDTDKMKWYGYDFSMFKFQYQYKRYPKMTTLLSKTIDVSELF